MVKPIRQLLLTAAAGLLLGVPVLAQSHDAGTVPDRREPLTDKFRRDTADVGITEHLGGQIPLTGRFTDTTGRDVTLQQYFGHNRAVVLQLGYFNCPMLCDVVSKALMDAIKGFDPNSSSDPQLGKDFDVLYVSVNPDEKWDLGRRKKQSYVEEYGRPEALTAWNFLVPRENLNPAQRAEQVQTLADAVGFGFKKVNGGTEFSHPPMVVVLTADGKISRYFYGFTFPTDALKASIKDADAGKVGGYVEQVLVALCYHYDEYSGKYSFAYMKVMQLGGVLTVLIVGTWLGRRWLKDARAARTSPPTPAL